MRCSTAATGPQVLGIAEVETVESVNHLEAMSEWASFGRLKVFHLCMPASAIDVARRMASDYQVALSELWSYDNVGDQVRFTLIQRSPEAPRPAARNANRPAGGPIAWSRRKGAGRVANAAPGSVAGHRTHEGRGTHVEIQRHESGRLEVAQERPRKAQRRR